MIPKHKFSHEPKAHFRDSENPCFQNPLGNTEFLRDSNFEDHDSCEISDFLRDSIFLNSNSFEFLRDSNSFEFLRDFRFLARFPILARLPLGLQCILD